MTIAVRCYVSGRVQGVFFRASARFQAESLGITGYARNLTDGRVEVLACGQPTAVNNLRAWLARGPSGARVSGVSCHPVSDHPPDSFTIG
ncbi:MAG: acylphosphatase [Gammaproteobacteria bacterium]|nr:acylphosphatase [Gammaproteobacteria bacterium]